MPQLEEPTAKNAQLCAGGLWGEKGKNKIFQKKKMLEILKKKKKRGKAVLFSKQLEGNKQIYVELLL